MPAGHGVLPVLRSHDIVNVVVELFLYDIVEMNSRAQVIMIVMIIKK